MPQNKPKLTNPQKDSLADFLIAAKRFFFAAPDTDYEKETARTLIETTDKIAEAFDEG